MYTKDIFTCGLCQKEMVSIDNYVSHMLKNEQCILVLEPSSFVKDLSLPRFKSKHKGSVTYRNNSEIEVKNSQESIVKTESSLAYEVETGKGSRWKCSLCFITFSRYKAFLNHYKLQHMASQDGADTKGSIIKIEPRESSLITSEADANGERILEDPSLPNINKFDCPPTCYTCGQIFKMERFLSSHIKTVHSEKRPFICEIGSCNVSFKTKGSLIRHQRRHTGERPYKCLHCERSYRESGSLLRHHQSKLSCINKTGKQLSRYGVTVPFESKVDCKLQLHLKKECFPTGAQSEENVESCVVEESKASVRLEIPLNKSPDVQKSAGVLQEKKPLLSLDMKEELICGEDQRVHKSSDAPEEKTKPLQKILRRSFMCPICYQTYDKEAYLSDHMKMHLEELGSECSTCFKKFNSDHALARHLLCHSSARQFECNICGKLFKLKSHAVSHLNSHSSDKTVPCGKCGRKFKSVSSRNNHMKIHIGEKNFECVVCLKRFLVKASLERHLRIHSKARPFQCPYCQRQFREQGTLARHIRSKAHCSQQNASTSKVWENILLNEKMEGRAETLSEINDNFSDTGTELESYLSERVDLSSIYSDPSDMSFDPEEYYIPPLSSNFENLCHEYK